MTTGIGETLRGARHQRGLSLDEAADETRIRAAHLEAIEQEQFERLGGEVYVRGFIRSYAKCLGVDPEPLLQQYRPIAEPSTVAEAPAPISHQPLERTPRRGLGLAVAALAALAIVGLALVGNNGPDTPVGLDDGSLSEAGDSPAGSAGGDPPSPADTTPATPTPSGSTPTRSGEDAVPAEGVRVVLQTVQRRVWLRAVVDGDQVLAETLPPGSTKTFESRERIRLRLGDAAAVQLTVNGQSQGSLGGSGEPVWVTIDADGNVTIG